MKDYIVERALEIGAYILETGATVRACAEKFHVSKTTVHKDMVERLPEINPELASAVKGMLFINKADRHIRGGRATKVKYLMERQEKQPLEAN